MSACEVSCQVCQRHRSEALKKKRLGIVEGVIQSGVDGLLNETGRVLVTIPRSEQRRLAQRFMQLAQADLREVRLSSMMRTTADIDMAIPDGIQFGECVRGAVASA